MRFDRATACAAVLVALSSGVANAQPHDTASSTSTTKKLLDLSGEWTGGGTGKTWTGPGAPGAFIFTRSGANAYAIHFVASAPDASFASGDLTGTYDGTYLHATWQPTSGVVGHLGGPTTAAKATSLVYEHSEDADFDHLVLVSGSLLPGDAKPPREIRRLKPPQVEFPAEWEQAEEILWGYQDTFSVSLIYRAAIKGCAANGEKAKHRFYVSSKHDQSELSYEFGEEFGSGPELGLVLYRSYNFGSVWMRDYGPWTVRKKGTGERVVGDLHYFPERPEDDGMPRDYAALRGWQRLDLSVLHMEGGNIMSDGRGRVFTSTRVLEGSSEAANDSQAIVESSLRKLGADEVIFLERMPEPEGTGHADMFSKLCDAKNVVVGRHFDPHYKYVLDRNAARFESLGYKVTRLDFARPEKVKGVGKSGLGLMTYTNALFVGDTVLVTNYMDQERDKAAMDAYRQLGWKPVGIDVRSIIAANGAIHCISMQVPAK